MKKVYLMNGLAIAAMALAATSCSKDLGGAYTVSEEQALANAEVQLGVEIDPNQTWKMTQTVNAKVTVNADFGEKYTVKIYQNNPLLTNSGIVLAQGEIANGGTFTSSFSAPKVSMLYAAYVDSKGYTYVKPVTISEGNLVAEFGNDGTTRGVARRTSTNSYVNIPTGVPASTVAAQAAEILAKSVEVNNNNYNFNNFDATTKVQKGTPDNYTGYDWGYIYNNGSTKGTISQEESDYYWNVIYPKYYGNFNQDVINDIVASGYTKLLWNDGGTEEIVEWNTNYVLNFKISSEWNGTIPVMGNIGQRVVKYHVDNESRLIVDESEYVPKTVYIDNGGKWIIGSDVTTTVGQGYLEDFVDAIIIVGKGGELQVNGTMNFANLARLVVLEGGKVTGSGTVQVNNGSKVGEESYNFGEISVAKFNENFGNFFNYGTITSNELQGGAGTSCYVNYGKVKVDHVSPNGEQAANLQIKNNCWFEATNRLACKLIENASGAYIQAGSLFMSDGEGGEGLGTYMALDTNSKVIVSNDAKLNGTLIMGPSTGDFAYVEFGTINFLNVGETYPISNNVNLYVGGFLGDNPNGYEVSWYTNLNAEGNGNAEMVGKAAFNTASTDASDCAPAFTPGSPINIVDDNPIYSYAFEDTWVGDYDMNDVVLKVQKDPDDKDYLLIKLVASGATLDLNIRLYPAAKPVGDEVAHYPNYEGGYTVLQDADGNTEVHDMFGVDHGVMVNTGATSGANAPVVTIRIEKGDYDPAALPLAIYSESQGEVRLSGAGTSPWGVMIPADWKWPKERIRITLAYNKTNAGSKGDQSFATFANDATAGADEWYNHPTGSVMSK